MKSLDDYDEALAEAIDIQNWDDISKYAYDAEKHFTFNLYRNEES